MRNMIRKMAALLLTVLLLPGAVAARGEAAPLALCPEIEPLVILAADYTAAADEIAAGYGATLEWSRSQRPDGNDVLLCERSGGMTALITDAQGRLLALTGAEILDPENTQESWQRFCAAMLATLRPVLCAGGMEKDAALETLLDACNDTPGFMSGVLGVLQTGVPLRFTFCGHDAEIAMLEYGEAVMLTLYVDFEATLPTEEAAPAETGEAAQASAESFRADDYVRAMNAIVAAHGGEVQWMTQDAGNGLTATVCVTLGSPVLLSEGDRLVALSAVSTYDPEEMQQTFDGFMGAMIAAMGPVLVLQGVPAEETIAHLTPVINAEGFIPSVIRVLTDGECFDFDFGGYPCTVSLEQAEGARWVTLFIDFSTPAGTD